MSSCILKHVLVPTLGMIPVGQVLKELWGFRQTIVVILTPLLLLPLPLCLPGQVSGLLKYSYILIVLQGVIIHLHLAKLWFHIWFYF